MARLEEEIDLDGLRAWQAEAITLYRQLNRRDYSVVATPGAGKTTFALTLAKYLLTHRKIDRIIIVAPTDHLRTQWGAAATKMGLLLDPNLGNDAILDKAYDGYVTTYAQVAMKPALHDRRTQSGHRTLVIMDEIHHAADGLTWGAALTEAFTGATRRLTLTGTPFRTSPNERIPFVKYEEDADGALRSTADYTYSYANALKDGVVRPVLFAAYSGVARWMDSAGDLLAADLSDPLSKDAEMAAWKTVLDASGEWVPHVIGAGAERLEEVRRAGMKDAAMLVLASDQDQAKEYAKIVEAVTGETPTLVLSEDPKASEKITTFSSSTSKFLVCVRMVSEGVDIPRAAVLVWLTSYRTPLFFAQAVGRVVRARATGEAATVFLPAVRPLLALAAELEVERDHVLARATVAEEDGTGELNLDLTTPETNTTSQFQALGASASFAHVLFGGRAVTAEPQLTVEEQNIVGIPGLLSPEQTAALLASREKALAAKAAKARKDQGKVVLNASPVNYRDPSLLPKLRKEITGLVNQVAAMQNLPHAHVHLQARTAVPGSANPQASVEVLEERRNWLLRRLGR